MNSLTDKEINRASDGIDKALSTATRSNRGEVAFRILSVVRNLNDHIAFKIWKDVRPDQKMDINKVASKFGNVRPYQFIARFDHFLRASVSHFTPSEEGAERLMIKYYRYLLQLKKAVYDRYGMIILRNIDMFLEDLDEQTKDYYQKVATEIEKRLRTPPPKNFDNYYIDKIKPFFVNQEIYYEVALEPADEKPNKFNRITAFTKYDISTDYCVALSFSNATISVFNTDFPIKIITEWHVSIRPCELNNFAELLNVECSVSRGLNEYKMVMSYLEQNGATLVDIIDYDQQEYDSIKNWVIASTQKRHSYIFDMLDICREISASKRDGANIIRYLLYRMNNRIIKDQQAHGDEKRYAGLNISSKCMPFDRNPYSFNPKGHISNLYDLFECIDTAGHKGELLSRYIEKNTNQNGVLFTPIDQLTMFGIPQEIEQTIEKYNRSLYSGFRPASELGVFKDYVYSKGCEIATVQIINKLEELADNVPTISSSFSEKMISQLKLLPAGQRLDDEVKEQILKTLFSESAVHLIYGAAGTGKTTLVNHISKLLEGKKKIYLAKTNPAVENLRRKVTCCDRSDEFTTIDKFVRSGWYETSNYDLVVVDECSTVKNEDRETPDRVYPTLLETIERHITEYGVSEFVVGQYGNFDRLVIRALSQAKRAHPDITLMLMTPYYPVNRKVDLPEEFDALFYPPDLETVPKRLAIVRANRYMVERSDFLIAYVRHPASNARELLEYAGTGKRKGKIHITNLADEQISLPKKTDDVI